MGLIFELKKEQLVLYQVIVVLLQTQHVDCLLVINKEEILSAVRNVETQAGIGFDFIDREVAAWIAADGLDQFDNEPAISALYIVHVPSAVHLDWNRRNFKRLVFDCNWLLLDLHVSNFTYIFPLYQHLGVNLDRLI